MTQRRIHRTLLAPDRLELFQRYEAHTSRQLFATLHELEALQERRHGRPAPLARVDVSGDQVQPVSLVQE